MALINSNPFYTNLTEMLEQHGGDVEQFIGTIFSFLAWKTDFYTATSVADAKKVILENFQKYGADAMEAEDVEKEKTWRRQTARKRILPPNWRKAAGEGPSKIQESTDDDDDDEDEDETEDNDQAEPNSDTDSDSANEGGLPSYQGTETRWSSKNYGFTPRFKHAAVVVDYMIYSFGGRTGHPTYPCDVLDVSVLYLDDTKIRWNLLLIAKNKNVPSLRWGHSAVAYETFVIIFGGWDNAKNDYSNSVHRFSTITLTWDDVIVNGDIPEARYYHVAVVVGKIMWVLGGGGYGATSDVYSLDLDTFYWSKIETKGKSPSNRWKHSAAVYEDKFIFMFGGCSGGCRNLSEFFCFDINSKEWSQPKTSRIRPEGQSGHSTFVCNGLVYIVGGGVADNFDSYGLTLSSYDPETFEWKQVKTIGEPPSPRIEFSCVELDGRIFIFGGWCPLGMRPKYFSDTFILDIGSDEIGRTVPQKEQIHKTDEEPRDVEDDDKITEETGGNGFKENPNLIRSASAAASSPSTLITGPSYTTEMNAGVDLHDKALDVTDNFTTLSQDGVEPIKRRSSRIQLKKESKENENRNAQNSSEDGSEEESSEKRARLYGSLVHINPELHKVKIESDYISSMVKVELTDGE